MSDVREAIAIPSIAAIWIRSFLASISVLGAAVFVQWLIYVNWMHEPGPVEVSGSVLAGVLMFLLVFRSKHSTRRSKMELMARLNTLRWMSDRIRNSLQAIECVTYSAAPNATNEVREAVDVIESILDDVLADPHGQKALRSCGAGPLHATTDPQNSVIA